MREFISFTLGGISFGMVYAAVGLSLVLIWRATRILNYAQGGMAMLTTFIALSIIHATGSYCLGFSCALAAGLVLGAIVERVVIRPVENKPPLNAIIVTIGLLVFLEGLAGIIYGGQFRSFPAAMSVRGLRVGSTHIELSRFDLFVTGSALAGLIGALAGVLVSPATFLYPNSMDSIFVLGFTAAVLGGLDSPLGAVVGGLGLGIVLNYVGGYLGSDLVTIFGLLLLVAVLMIRPSGLFSAARTRRV